MRKLSKEVLKSVGIKSKYGHDVSVSHKIQLTRESMTTISLTAYCGKVKHRKRVTFGATNGVRGAVLPTLAELQDILDRHRQAVADEASWREHVRATTEGIS